MAVFSCTKITIVLVIAYFSYTFWAIVKLFYPTTCTPLKGPDNCSVPLFNEDTTFEVRRI